MRSDPTSTDDARRRPGLRAAACLLTAVLAPAVLLAGCGKDDTPASSAPATTTAPATTRAPSPAATDPLMGSKGGLHNSDPSSNIGGVPGPGGATCVSKAPGEVYTAAEAVILFSPETICPGYVTVTVGTPVTFDNRDSVAHVVKLTRGQGPDAPVVATETVGAGQTWRQTFDAAGDVTFRIDAIPSFVGTISVLG